MISEVEQTISSWANVPFAPRKFPFFYGWVIVIVATLGAVASVPGQTIGVGVFTDDLVKVLSLSRMQLSLAYMLGTLVSSFLLPWAGSLTDRWGTRVMITVSALGLGGSLLVMMQLNKLPQVVSSVAGLVGLTAGVFLLIRFFGQGCLMMVSRVMIGRWFDRRRGLASGISNILVSYLFNASPFLLNVWVESVGWRWTYARLSVLVGVGMAAIGWVFFRDSPEECGLEMDGGHRPNESSDKKKRVPEVVHEFTRTEAIRTPAFWAYSLATAWQALFMTAVGFHLTSMGEEQGLSREACYRLFPIIGLVSGVSALLGGWLSDRIRLRWLLQATVICQVFSALGLFGLAGGGGRILFIVSYSVSAAFFGLLLTTVWPRYYGRKHLGAISGLASSALVSASAIGPFLFSMLRNLSESYRPVFLVSSGTPLLLLVLTAFARNPQLKQ